jgi:tetratricopeptide (TPR) repeat protein
VYPDHIESLSNIGAVYFLLGQYEKALTPLLTAYQLNPKDLVVINNIAEIYNELGLNIKAEAYYRLMMKYGDKQDKKYAKAKIKQLK